MQGKQIDDLRSKVPNAAEEPLSCLACGWALPNAPAALGCASCSVLIWLKNPGGTPLLSFKQRHLVTSTFTS